MRPTQKSGVSKAGKVNVPTQGHEAAGFFSLFYSGLQLNTQVPLTLGKATFFIFSINLNDTIVRLGSASRHPGVHMNNHYRGVSVLL